MRIRDYSSVYAFFLTLLLAFSAFNCPLQAHELGEFKTANGEDPASLMLVATIDLDKEPRCIAVNDETGLIYVGVENGTLVIDGATNNVLTEIPLENGVWVIAVNPTNNHVYAACLGELYVEVIDGATNAVVGEIREHVSSPWEIAIDPVANLVYIEHTTTILGRYDQVVAYDANTLREKFRVNIPGSTKPYYVQSMGVTVNPETNRVYATWSYNDNLYMMDGHTHEIVKNVSISPHYSNNIMVNPRTNRIYVVDYPNGIILDGKTLEHIGTCSDGLKAINPLSNLLYVEDHDTVVILDGDTNLPLAFLELENTISNLAVNSKTGMIYATHWFDRQISVIDGRFTYSDLSVETSTPEPGQSFTVEVTVANICHFEASTTVDLLVEGKAEDYKDVQLGAGESEVLSFELVKEEGTYTIGVNGFSREVSVELPPLESLFSVYLPHMIGAAVLVGLVAGIVILYRRRRPSIVAPVRVLQCPFCGAEMPPGAVFCQACGRKVR